MEIGDHAVGSTRARRAAFRAYALAARLSSKRTSGHAAFRLGKPVLDLSFCYLRSNALDRVGDPRSDRSPKLPAGSGRICRSTMRPLRSASSGGRRSARYFDGSPPPAAATPVFCTAGERSILAAVAAGRGCGRHRKSDLRPKTPKTIIDPDVFISAQAAGRARHQSRHGGRPAARQAERRRCPAARLFLQHGGRPAHRRAPEQRGLPVHAAGQRRDQGPPTSRAPQPDRKRWAERIGVITRRQFRPAAEAASRPTSSSTGRR